MSTFVQIESPWLRLIGEKLQDESRHEYEYWRVEKPDGLLVLTIQNNKLLLPKQMYRPGIKQYTLDFCGGRITTTNSLEQEAQAIVRRELKIKSKKPFVNFRNINSVSWNVDSSFSNVKIYGCVVELSPKIIIDPKDLAVSYPLTKRGMNALLDKLVCLQCRAMLREWLAQEAI